MKRFSVFVISTLLSFITYGAKFLVIECYAYPNGYAYFSDPITGKPIKAKSCGEALATVPSDYFFLSSAGGGGAENSGGVKFLFSDTPHKE